MVKLGHERLERGISEVGPGDLRNEHHPVQPEDVERVAQLLQRRVHVWQWQSGKRGEPLRCPAHDRGQLVVEDPCELIRLTLIAEEHAWRPRRDHRRVDPVSPHHLIECLHRDRLVGGGELLWQRLDVDGGPDVRMHVDPWHDRSLRPLHSYA